MERYERLRSQKVDPREDNALAITIDGRKLATDARMLSPTAPDFEGSKVNRLIENVTAIWRETAPVRGAQMIFCDMGVNPTPWGYSVYEDVTRKLVAAGVPAEQVATIGEADSDAKKQALFEKVRQGEARKAGSFVRSPGTPTVEERPDMSNPGPGDKKTALSFDGLRVGQRFVSGTHRIDEGQIRAFANEFDPQPFHLDPEAAKDSFFGELVASGWHTASVAMRLLVEGGVPLAGGIVGVGGEIAWPAPVRPGDILQVESEVVELRPSRSRPDRGIVTVRSETRNQRGEVVQVLVAKLVVPRAGGFRTDEGNREGP